ncbi:MAG: hypothetical protein AAGI88_17575 [Pseudomonadota bacterium]
MRIMRGFVGIMLTVSSKSISLLIDIDIDIDIDIGASDHSTYSGRSAVW